MLKNNYNPDVLDAIANLSNDEVFTPPKIVNEVLDLLPTEIWSDSTITILDPACKSGVFLREAAKRFINGLESEFPDLQKRLNHIYTKQLFGISITELTSLLSRRSVYCSKYANGKYSMCTEFEDNSGNIRYERTEHNRKNGKCISCGASMDEYDRKDKLETHAYKFIHGDLVSIKSLFNTYKNMKFDVIIGNPPYQLSDGGNSASAKPLYHHFVEQAKKMNPRYLSMIIPSRRFTGGKGLDSFRKEMVSDRRIKELHDFFDAKDCFPGVEIKGGVCYFLREKDHNGHCEVSSHEGGKIVSQSTRSLQHKEYDIFIRYNEAISILEKVQSFKEESFRSIVSSRKPFGLSTTFSDYKSKPFDGSVKIYANKKTGYINQEIIAKHKELINSWKIFVPYAIGNGDGKSDLMKPLIGERFSCSTETYLLIGPFEDNKTTINVVSYMNTSFFHFLLTLLKNTQHTTSKTYEFIPLQDFSKKWTDDELFDKYGFTDKEVAFIKSMTHPSL